MQPELNAEQEKIKRRHEARIWWHRWLAGVAAVIGVMLLAASAWAYGFVGLCIAGMAFFEARTLAESRPWLP